MATKRRAIAVQSLEVWPEHTYQEIMAVRALAGGTASDNQQKVAFDWILKKACIIGGLSNNPNRANDIYINEGRRYVGATLMDMITETQISIDQRFPGPKSGRERRDLEGDEE